MWVIVGIFWRDSTYNLMETFGTVEPLDLFLIIPKIADSASF